MRSNKFNKVNVLVPALMTAVFALPTMASDRYNDTARVISVTPQFERVNAPRQECRTDYEQQSYREEGHRSIAGAVIGGVAGGLLGSTIGRGNGRVAAAAVGAGVGAIAGDRIGNNQYNHRVVTRSVPVQTCYQVDNWQSVNAGYLVNYEYNGRVYSTVTNNHPGRFIDVNVAVSQASRPVTQISYYDSDRDSDWNDGHRRHHKGKHRGWDKHDRDDRYY
ncbi:MAG TPA: glycine zipper domain-containing protein [Methylotenera sp.]|nr:glycine zipper domain-containing protein [Methylotenera sp.]